MGRIDVVRPEKLPTEAKVLLDETQIPERPEVMVAVASSRVTHLDRFPLMPYLKPVAPFLDYTFWRHGRQITEAEAMPFLRGIFGAEWQLPRRAA